MPNLDYEDKQLLVGDGIHHAVDALANPVSVVVPGELFAACGPGFVGQGADSSHHPLPGFLIREGLELFGR